MKSYLIILILTLVSCSNFLFKQKKMRDINDKASFSILQELVNQGINFAFELIDQLFDIALYITDNSKSSKITNDINEYSKIAKDFLKVHKFSDLIKLEKKFDEEVVRIRLNPEKIIAYMKKANFPSDIIEYVDFYINKIAKRDEQIFYFYPLYIPIEQSKDNFINPEIREGFVFALVQLIKKLGNEIDIEKIPQINEELINDIKSQLDIIEVMMPDIIYATKFVFETIKSTLNNKMKFAELRKYFRTFFKTNYSTSIEDYDLLNESYDVLVSNLLNKIIDELKIKYPIDYFIKIFINDLNILVHENHKGEAYMSEILKIVEKIVIYYNVQNFVSDFKNAFNELKNIVVKLKNGDLHLEKFLPKLKENLLNFKEENIKNIVNGLLDHIKIFVTS